jgi:hypothetical protein
MGHEEKALETAGAARLKDPAETRDKITHTGLVPRFEV